jgi:AcrR family transcriptional regulator
MSSTGAKRKTQAERRAESRQAVLDSACRLFGEKGYAETSLEEIARDCGLTIRPIYHYFGNKKALFAAVNEVMDQRILASMTAGPDAYPGAGTLASWRAFLDLCDDPGFRRIVLVDGPNILGREGWSTSAVNMKARSMLGPDGQLDSLQQYRANMFNRVILGAFTEAALMIAESNDIELARREAERLMTKLFSGYRDFLNSEPESNRPEIERTNSHG